MERIKNSIKSKIILIMIAVCIMLISVLSIFGQHQKNIVFAYEEGDILVSSDNQIIVVQSDNTIIANGHSCKIILDENYQYIWLRPSNEYGEFEENEYSNCLSSQTIDIFVPFDVEFNSSIDFVEATSGCTTYISINIDDFLFVDFEIGVEFDLENGGVSSCYFGLLPCNINIYVTSSSLLAYESLTGDVDYVDMCYETDLKTIVSRFNNYFSGEEGYKSSFEDLTDFYYLQDPDYWLSGEDLAGYVQPDGRQIRILSLDDYMDDENNDRDETVYSTVSEKLGGSTANTGIAVDIVLPSIIMAFIVLAIVIAKKSEKQN